MGVIQVKSAKTNCGGLSWAYPGGGLFLLLLFLEESFDGYRLSPFWHDRGLGCCVW